MNLFGHIQQTSLLFKAGLGINKYLNNLRLHNIFNVETNAFSN